MIRAEAAGQSWGFRPCRWGKFVLFLSSSRGSPCGRCVWLSREAHRLPHSIRCLGNRCCSFRPHSLCLSYWPSSRERSWSFLDVACSNSSRIGILCKKEEWDRQWAAQLWTISQKVPPKRHKWQAKPSSFCLCWDRKAQQSHIAMWWPTKANAIFSSWQFP